MGVKRYELSEAQWVKIAWRRLPSATLFRFRNEPAWPPFRRII